MSKYETRMVAGGRRSRKEVEYSSVPDSWQRSSLTTCEVDMIPGNRTGQSESCDILQTHQASDDRSFGMANSSHAAIPQMVDS